MLWRDINVVLPTCNILKNEIPAQLLSFEFYEFFHTATLLKKRLQHRCFLVNFTNFSASNFVKNEIPEQVFFFWILRNFSACNQPRPQSNLKK